MKRCKPGPTNSFRFHRLFKRYRESENDRQLQARLLKFVFYIQSSIQESFTPLTAHTLTRGA
ncbi:hypothetical protein TH63_14190 [Rufibacter radiotolerans]|uniref:Uncharacterized protein n=1 Tax=Rufibacter radiotolerans TaxID=1379910 RepID=A0A0H4VL34_9BACT|nr:hypothetical protein TH63_14190 [Rufibacter radiotolerans]